MKWTTEKPTQSGWFWVRTIDDRTPLKTRMVMITKHGNNLFIYLPGSPSRPIDEFATFARPVEWMGPIPVPE